MVTPPSTHHPASSPEQPGSHTSSGWGAGVLVTASSRQLSPALSTGSCRPSPWLPPFPLAEHGQVDGQKARCFLLPLRGICAHWLAPPPPPPPRLRLGPHPASSSSCRWTSLPQSPLTAKLPTRVDHTSPPAASSPISDGTNQTRKQRPFPCQAVDSGLLGTLTLSSLPHPVLSFYNHTPQCSQHCPSCFFFLSSARALDVAIPQGSDSGPTL